MVADWSAGFALEQHELDELEDIFQNMENVATSLSETQLVVQTTEGDYFFTRETCSRNGDPHLEVQEIADERYSEDEDKYWNFHYGKEERRISE